MQHHFPELEHFADAHYKAYVLFENALVHAGEDMGGYQQDPMAPKLESYLELHVKNINKTLLQHNQPQDPTLSPTSI